MTQLWRAQAQLLQRRGALARVRIPAMQAGHDTHWVPLDIVPDEIEIGDRFRLRCTLDHEDFAVDKEQEES